MVAKKRWSAADGRTNLHKDHEVPQALPTTLPVSFQQSAAGHQAQLKVKTDMDAQNQVEGINWGLLSVGTNFRFLIHAHELCCGLMILKTRGSSWQMSSISDFLRTKRNVNSATCSRPPVCKCLINNYHCALLTTRCLDAIDTTKKTWCYSF